MTRHLHTKRAALLLLAISVAILTSCGEDKTTDTGDVDLPRETAEELLQQYTESLEAADLDDYADCLDEAYKFIFTPWVAEEIGLPPEAPWWHRNHDLASTEFLFDHADLHSIQFALTVVDQDTTDAGGDPVITVQMDPEILVTLNPPNEEPVFLEVTETWLYFRLIPDAADERFWVISEIEEENKTLASADLERPGPALVPPLTLGDIKVLFFPLAVR